MNVSLLAQQMCQRVIFIRSRRILAKSLTEKPIEIRKLQTVQNVDELVRKLLYVSQEFGIEDWVSLTMATTRCRHPFLGLFPTIWGMSRETILILDRELHTQWTLKTLLEGEKYIVLAVDTVERALQNFREFEVSGLITEYRMDHILTYEIIRELKKNFPELYVMMVTHENLEEREYRKMMRCGIDDFFLKPVSGEKILIHLKKGLRQRKILLQKKRLEQKLDEMKANGTGQEVAFGIDMVRSRINHSR